MNEHFHYPISFEKAEKHMLANRIFKGNTQQTTEQCSCCSRKIGQKQVQTNCNISPDQLSFLGPGVPLFFLYLKSIIQMLLLMTIIFMGFALYSNIVQNSCSLDVSCIASTFNIISIINKQSNIYYLSIQAYLALTFIIISILYFHYFRYKARQLQLICDEVVDSPSDYAIILRRLPKEITQKHIQDLIKSKLDNFTQSERKETQNLKIVKIILSYQLRQYLNIHQQNIKKFKQMQQDGTISSFEPKQLPKLNKTSSIAIVIFQNQLSKSFFIHEPTIFQKILQFFCTSCVPLTNLQIKDTKISIQRAPQPDDILWQNSGITMNGSIIRKILYGIVLFIILSIGGMMQYGLAFWSYNTTDQSLKNMITFGSSLFITIFNVFLTFFITFLTEKQRNQTLTEFQTVLMVKMTIFQFLNAGIFVILAQTIVNFEHFTLKQQICEQITTIMILNALLPNLILLILQYSQIINRVKRYIVQKKWINVTQIQVNQIYAGPSIDLPHKYAYILKTLLLTALYATITPIVIGISMIGLILFYFIQKFLYTRSYRVPNNVSSESFKTAIEILEYFLITFALGQLIIYYYFYKYVFQSVPLQWTIVILISISLAFMNSALPMDTLNEKILKISQSSHSKIKYTQIQSTLEVTYEMKNPAYKTDRKRQNIKDLLGAHFFDKNYRSQSKKQELEMSHLIKVSAIENKNSMIKQPLLQNNTFQKNQKNKHNEQKNDQKVHLNYNQVKSGNKDQKIGNQQKDLEQKNQQAQSPQITQIDKEIKVFIKTPKNKILDSPLNPKNNFKPQKQRKKLRFVRAQYNYDRLISQIFNSKQQNEGLLVAESNHRQRSKSNSQIVNDENKQKNQLQDNINKLYANLNQNQKQQSQSKNFINFDNVQINSKYHQSNGKVNIFAQYIVENTNKKAQILRRNIISKIKKQKEKKIQSNQKNYEKIVQKQPQRNKFRFINIQQIRVNQNERCYQSQKEPSIQEASKDKVYNNLLEEEKLNTNDLKQKYKQNISSIQRKNSVSSLSLSNNSMNNGKDQQFKDYSKQKKATYDPLKLNQSYKQFFKERANQKDKILNKGKVMKYLGAPFTKFVKEQKDQSPFLK